MAKEAGKKAIHTRAYAIFKEASKFVSKAKKQKTNVTVLYIFLSLPYLTKPEIYICLPLESTHKRRKH